MSDTINYLEINQYIDGSMSIEYHKHNKKIGKGIYGITTKKELFKELSKIIDDVKKVQKKFNDGKGGY